MVQVEFTSPRDGRVYRVERTMRRARSRATGVLAENATTTVSLYDVELNRAIDQPAVELEAWLAGQLGVEGLSSPADVFEHVVGVPQGRLTADFLDSPRLRQARFDPILRTAEFQVAVERLRPLTQHYAQARHALQVKASHLEGRLAAEPELRSRLSAAQQALEQTRAAEAKATTELETANANLAARDAQRTAFETSERAYAAAMERRQQAADQAKRACGGGAGKSACRGCAGENPRGAPRLPGSPGARWRAPTRRTPGAKSEAWSAPALLPCWTARGTTCRRPAATSDRGP